jgi:hypothetical protein
MFYHSGVAESPLKNGRNLMPQKESSDAVSNNMLTNSTLEQQLMEMQNNFNINEETGQFSRLGYARISYVGAEPSVTPNETVAHSNNAS